MQCELHFDETMHFVWNAVVVSMIIILHAHSLCEMTYSVVCCTLIVNVIQCCYNENYLINKMHLEVWAAVCTLKFSGLFFYEMFTFLSVAYSSLGMQIG